MARVFSPSWVFLDTAVFCNLELAQWMLFSLEIPGIAPLAPNATTERHAYKFPLGIKASLMINTGMGKKKEKHMSMA